MRIFLLALGLSVIAAPAAAATRNFGISDFQKVRVDGPFRVRLATGDAPFARAVGSRPAVARVAIEVRVDSLIVHNDLDSWGRYPGKDAGPVEVEIGIHDLT